MAILDRLNNSWTASKTATLNNIADVPDPSIRYKNNFEYWFNVINGHKTIATIDETKWLFTVSDYMGVSDSAFEWNFIELLELDACDERQEDILKVKTFWDDILPVGMSVRDGYRYFGLNIDGSFVSAIEPYFDDYRIIGNSDSFVNYLNDIV